MESHELFDFQNVLGLFSPLSALSCRNSSRTSTPRRIFSPIQVYNQTGWPSGWAFCMTFLSPTWTLSGYDVAAHAVAEETHDPEWKSGAAGAPCYSGPSTCSVRDKEGFLAASLLPPRASSSAVTRLSRGTPGSKRTHTPNNASLAVFVLSSTFGAISIGSDTAFLLRVDPSWPDRVHPARAWAVLGRCLGGACTRTTPSVQTGRTTLGGGARLSGGLRLRGISSSCRWLACEHSDQEPRSSYGIF